MKILSSGTGIMYVLNVLIRRIETMSETYYVRLDDNREVYINLSKIDYIFKGKLGHHIQVNGTEISISKEEFETLMYMIKRK